MKTRLSLPAGTTDIFGPRMRRRENVLSLIRGVYEKFGFEPLHTPILEHEDVFKGHHGEGEKLLFRLNDQKGTPLVLRYDLTVPLARVVSMYPEIQRPFKRYHIAPSFRDDEVDHGHFREFIQCDGDVIGISDLTADADVIAMAHTGLKCLGFKSFVIRVNHRAIIKGLAEYACGKDCDVLVFQRALDFADKSVKQGIGGVKNDLKNRGMGDASIDRFVSILGLSGKPLDSLNKVSEKFGDYPNVLKGVSELQEIFSYLPQSVIDSIVVDFTLARGADYYTGFILEGIIPGIPVGAVLGGGRYDNLVAACGGNNEPAVGMAFGLERILTAMDELSLQVIQEIQTILLYPSADAMKKQAFLAAQKLREADISVDFLSAIDSDERAVAYAKHRCLSVIVSWSDGGRFSITPLQEGIHFLVEKIRLILSSL